jgi:anti-sigma B factor antagonist
MSDARALDLHITISANRGATIVQAVGELDLASAERLQTALQSSLSNGVVVLDASGIAFCDSAGIKAILRANHDARELGTALRLAAPSDSLTQVMELVGLFTVLDVFPDVPAALAA